MVMAPRDYVVGRTAKKPDGGAHKRNGDVIGGAGKRSSTLTPTSRQKTEPICGKKILSRCILQPIALQIENVQKAGIASQCRPGKGLAFAARSCLDRRPEALGGVTIKVGEATMALPGHPSNQHAQMLERAYERAVPGAPMAGRRIDS